MTEHKKKKIKMPKATRTVNFHLDLLNALNKESIDRNVSFSEVVNEKLNKAMEKVKL